MDGSRSGPSDIPAIECRLCGAVADFRFNKRILGWRETAYFECRNCGSLETEAPDWLEEAYDRERPSADTGAAQRILDSYALVSAIAWILKPHRILDWGGGTGLLCRLLRDDGWDAYTSDRYAAQTFACGFTAPADVADFVTLFEVAEHLSNPRQEFAELFGELPAAVLVSTELYEDQDDRWWYLGPEHGQHVFFYSPKAMTLTARAAGYEVAFGRGFSLFTRKPLSLSQRGALNLFSRRRVLRFLRALLLARRKNGFETDQAIVTTRLQALGRSRAGLGA